jgi:hypothetical protein
MHPRRQAEIGPAAAALGGDRGGVERLLAQRAEALGEVVLDDIDVALGNAVAVPAIGAHELLRAGVKG